jgi:membrane associated rhomboid family serine protease
VTFALLAICVLGFAGARLAESAARARAESELEAAVQYLNGHLHLEPGPILGARLDLDALAQKRAAEETARVRRGSPPIPQRVQARQQQQLDALVAAAWSGASVLPAQRWGFRASDFDALSLLTHPFLHTSALQLSGCLILLLLLGRELEPGWGSARFAATFVAAAAASALVYGVALRGFEAPLVGLGGALAALLGAWAIRRRSRWREPAYAFSILAGGAFLIVPVHFGSDWSIAASLEQAQLLADHPGASLWAVAGGFGFGLLVEAFAALLATSAPGAEDGAARATRTSASPELVQAVNARAAGRLTEARELLVGIGRGRDPEREAWVLLWDVALELGHTAEASDAMLRAIRADLKCNDVDAAVDHWLDLTNRGLAADAEPALLIRMALALQQREQRFAAVAALQQALAHPEAGDSAVVACRVARASRDLDADTARDAAWRALGSMDLELEERQGLEAMLGEIGPGIDLELPPRRDRAIDLPPPAASERVAGLDLSGESLAVGTGAAGEASQRPPDVWEDALLSEEPVVELCDVVAGDRAGAAAEDAAVDRPAPIDLEFVTRTARAVAATPVALDAEGLLVEVPNGAKKRVPLDKIEALAVAAVGGLGPKAVIVIDVVMNWESGAGEPLKILRIRGDRFDPTALMAGTDDPLEALRAFTRELLYKSATLGLPDPQSVAGMPFAAYDDLASYERVVLGVEA